MRGLRGGDIGERGVFDVLVLRGGGVNVVRGPVRRVVGVRGVFLDLFLMGPARARD